MTAAMAAIPQIHAMFEPVAATGDDVGVAEDAGRGVGALGTGCVGAVVGCGCGAASHSAALAWVSVPLASAPARASSRPSPYIVMTSIVPHGTWFPSMRTSNGVGPFAGSLYGFIMNENVIVPVIFEWWST